MEMVKLSTIVTRLSPELYPFLTQHELETCIVLKNGVDQLAPDDVLEIVENSIYKHQKDTLIH